MVEAATIRGRDSILVVAYQDTPEAIVNSVSHESLFLSCATNKCGHHARARLQYNSNKTLSRS